MPQKKKPLTTQFERSFVYENMVIINLNLGFSQNRFITVRSSPSQDFYREAAQKIQSTHYKIFRTPSPILS